MRRRQLSPSDHGAVRVIVHATRANGGRRPVRALPCCLGAIFLRWRPLPRGSPRRRPWPRWPTTSESRNFLWQIDRECRRGHDAVLGSAWGARPPD